MTDVGDGDATITAITMLIDRISQTTPLIVAGLIDMLFASAEESDDFGRTSLVAYADSLESIYTANHRLTDTETQNIITDLHGLLVNVRSAVEACRIADLAGPLVYEPVNTLEEFQASLENDPTLEQFSQMQSIIDDLRRHIDTQNQTIADLNLQIQTLTAGKLLQ